MNRHVTEVVPFCLKDTPSLIERIFPSMKISAEAQKERKANLGQTLTVLGSFWKGRKPLILVRACILGCLLPATDDPEADLAVFEKLMAIDDEAFAWRVKRRSDFPAVLSLPYDQRVANVLRPDELPVTDLPEMWSRVNEHLGTRANSLQSLVEQLGIMRFGRKPVIADTFAGGGSIPFESARVGSDVYASDLNPVACMLTWGALNLIGGDHAAKEEMAREEDRVLAHVEREITRMGIEYDEHGNRAKAYLYCMEAVCPETGWSVPMLPTRIISKARNTIVDLVPDEVRKRYEFMVRSHVNGEEIARAEVGTVVNGRLIHPMSPSGDGVAITSIRGDYKAPNGARRNKLRQWTKKDFRPAPDDILQERLYCIQWIKQDSIGKARQETFFAAPTEADIEREQKVERIVAENLSWWQEKGFVPDLEIEAGDETSRLIRERGWSHWAHVFTPRDLVTIATIREVVRTPALFLALPSLLNHASKLCQWITSAPRKDGSGKQVGGARELPNHVFYNQALNTFWNYASRASHFLLRDLKLSGELEFLGFGSKREVMCHPANKVQGTKDIYITDPPYADAVNYHEITEFFIAWLRKQQPSPFDQWQWDSRRRLAIKGKGEEFRSSMVEAYKAMADHMPDNGIQVVMFTHQDGKVWSDMAQIFWGAGLQVMADWYIATETTSELKKGGYVQGTHIIVLRKRAGTDSGYSDEITQEVKEEVARQIEEMVGLNQELKGHGRSENLFNDADLQMAGYAAALRVLTKYVKIDGKDMTVEAMRPRGKNERTVIDDIIEYAVQVANEHLVPEGMSEQTWRRLAGTERFYLKMLDIETTGAKKVDNYQNFAKAFRVPDYGSLMSSVSANAAALKSAKDFGKRLMGEDEFGRSPTRTILYALWEMANGVDDELVVGHVRDLVDNYLERRSDLISITSYIQAKRQSIDREESQNAGILAGLIKNERLG
ncbi:MAG: DUF1156 domain-containing protein [Mesorhizobium sp.]|uniref:anti-phage-associated DUF1156 domain-containing protein n=1 Tax=Mesorhizobium sp. TaxID=1871066 RepID=UPI000FE5BABF|nr:anti-phage-associated DUF1156 domain-containing protein [Mesorhizobium sp.]RWL80662.1 MAG: DUF1156 domain-containing protein [Mesorhizobium sp.]